MKATELMVGDWVYDKHFNGDIEPIQIHNIYGTEVNCKTARNHFDVDEIVSGTYMSDLQPIPLTPEILEENGFNISSLTDNRWTYGDIALSKVNDYYVFSSMYDEYMIGTRPHIYYVHELQHALRLCGINKEIEL